MYFQVSYGTDNHRSLQLNQQYADETFKNEPVTYFMPTDRVGSYINVKFEQCIGNTGAYLGFRKYSQSMDSIAWKTLEDDDMSKSLHIQEEGVYYLRFKRLDQKVGRLLEGEGEQESTEEQEKREKEEKNKKIQKFRQNAPSVFTFEAELGSTYSEHLFSTYIEEPQLRGPSVNADTVPVVSVSPIKIKNFSTLVETNNIVVNYTLYVSNNKDMAKAMSKCDNFDLDVLKKYYGQPSVYTFSIVDYYGKRHDNNFYMSDSMHKFTVKTLTFGENLYGVVVARIAISPSSVIPLIIC